MTDTHVTPDTMFGVTLRESIPRDDTAEYTYEAYAFTDHIVTVQLLDDKGFEKYYAHAVQHPSEEPTDTVRRLIDRIEDEYFGAKD